MKKVILLAFLFTLPNIVLAFTGGIPAVTVTQSAAGGSSYSVSLQILFLMTALSLLPGMFMAMTSFTRIMIVLAILRQAMGLTQSPTSQILIGLSLFLTFFIMAPVFTAVNNNALQPYINGKISEETALNKAQEPIRKFMLNQTRTNDLELFESLSGKKYNSIDKVPFYIILPAFVTSELKTAFQIGFILFLPFLVIDLIVASVLMSMGMMMLSPLIISLPFKIMMFVMIDGWTLVLGTLASSFMT